MKKLRGQQVAGLVAGLTAEDATMAGSILDRLKHVANVNSDGALARALGLTQSSVSTAKSKGVVPPGWIINASNLFNVSADWLIYGDEKGAKTQAPQADQTPAPAVVATENTKEVARLEKELLDAYREIKNLRKQIAQLTDRGPEYQARLRDITRNMDAIIAEAELIEGEGGEVDKEMEKARVDEEVQKLIGALKFMYLDPADGK